MKTTMQAPVSQDTLSPYHSYTLESKRNIQCITQLHVSIKNKYPMYNILFDNTDKAVLTFFS